MNTADMNTVLLALDTRLTTDKSLAYAQREMCLEAMSLIPAAGNHTWAVLADKVERLDVLLSR